MFWMKLTKLIFFLLLCVECLWKILAHIFVKMPGKKYWWKSKRFQSE